MTRNTKLSGLAAFTGLLMLAASPTLAQSQYGTAPQNQPAPGSETSPTAPPVTGSTDQANPAAASNQGMTGSQGTTGTSAGTTNSAKMSASAESLSHVKDAKTTLASAQVQDSSGQQVGQVSTVHTSRHGTPTKVDITLTGSNGAQAKVISVSASKLKYDPNSNTLITNLSATDLQAMPAASSSSM